MASTSSDVGIGPDWQALLDWVPKSLTTAPKVNHFNSTEAPNKPSFYDKHLSNRVSLKHVKLIESLVHDIADTVDEPLKQVLGDAEVPPYPFNPGVLRWIYLSMDEELANQLSVSGEYFRSVALFCPPAASLLAFYPQLKTWDSVIVWRQGTVRHHHAIPGGSLQFRKLSESGEDKKGIRLDEEMETLLHDVREKFKDLAVWGFKTPLVGNDQVMQGIIDEANTDIPFVWVSCEGAAHCRSEHPIVDPPVGPDADVTPWKLPSVSAEGFSEDGPSGLSLIGDQGGRITRPRKRKRGEFPAIKVAEELTSQRYLQQVWAEAVRVDATLLVLNSGNYECVAVRHRESRTLFISDIYQPHTLKNPGYGKLHIGIYIAAVRDALDRFKKLSEAPSSQPFEDDNDGGEDRGDRDDENAKGSDQKGKGRDKGGRKGRGRGGESPKKRGRGRRGNASGNEVEESPVDPKIGPFSKRRVLFMYLQFGVYDSPVPATFLRMIPPEFPKIIAPTTRIPLDENMVVVLTSELGEGGTGTVHGGDLEVETPEGVVSLDVVAKIALRYDQRDSLKHEASIYCHLASKDVKNIPTMLGLFEDIADAALVLLLTPTGVPIDDKGQLSDAAKQNFRSTLEEIHLADILHGDIRHGNLLVNESGGVNIIDFDRSKKKPSKEAMAREMSHLIDLLD